MPTTKLGLPTIAGNASADVVRDFNALATAVDDKAGASNGLATLGADGKVPSGQLNVQAPADASTTVKGIVMLEDSVTSTSVTKAATPKSVKTAMDRADAAFQSASDGKTAVANAITAKGVTASPSDTFPALATKISQINLGKKWASGVITPASGFPHDFSVTGLVFRPTVIILESSTVRKVYLENAIMPGLNSVNYTSASATSTDGFTVTNDGFSSSNFGSSQITWRAFE